jgi:hypothetical protein
MELLPTSSSKSYGIDHDEFRLMALQFWTEIEGANPIWIFHILQNNNIMIETKEIIQWQQDAHVDLVSTDDIETVWGLIATAHTQIIVKNKKCSHQ